ADLPAHDLHAGDRRLARIAVSLEHRTGARVGVFDAAGRKLVATSQEEPFPPIDATGAERPRGSLLRTGGTTADEARVAMPVRAGNQRFVVALVKPLDDVAAAAADVRRAFTTAALVGLAVAFLFGIAL